MKYIIDIIQLDCFHDVHNELVEKEIHLFTVSSFISREVAEIYRSHKEPVNLLKKIKLEITVNDEYIQSAIEAITGGAERNNISNGKIFLKDMEEFTQIHTSERNEAAVGQKIMSDHRKLSLMSSLISLY